MRRTASRALLAALGISLTFSGLGTPASAGTATLRPAAILPITITMPAAGNATVSNAQYSSQDVYPGVVTGVATPPSGITPLQRLAALNPPNFRIHAGTDGGSTTVALPFNAAYTSSDAVHVNAWDFNNLNSLVANTGGLTSGPTVINVRYAPDNMFTGSGPMGGNATAEGVLVDQTYVAFGAYMANLVKYYNTASPPPGAVPPRPANIGPIRYWEIWNEPDYASENPRIPPALPPPSGVTLTAVSVAGGTLVPSSTYSYRITGITSSNGQGLPSTAASITLPPGSNAVKITWNASTKLGRLAAAYQIYGRTSSQGQLVVVGKDNPAGLSWTDTGSITAPGGPPPTADSTLAGPVFSPLEYKALWDKAVPAMKAVDPTIKVVGPVATIGSSVITTAVTTGPNDSSYLDGRNYVQALMSSTNQPDVISFHGYGGFQGAADSDSSLMGPGLDYIVNDVATNVRPYSGTTPIWQTEANVNSGDDSTNRPALAFGAAWDAALFARLAPIGVSTIHQYTYVNSSTFGLITEPGSSVPGAVAGNPYLPYWLEYWIDHLFAPGAKILSVANVPAGMDVLAVANPPDFTKVSVLVVNRQVPATNTAASVLLAGATSTATQGLVIDSATNLVSGPIVSNLGAVQTGNLQLNGYSVGLIEFDTGTGIPGPVVTGVSPNHGPAAGGTSVTITGTGFSGATSVMFGSTAATTFTVNGPTQISATSPAGSGTVEVTVTTPNGTSPTAPADRFTYDVPPGPPLNVTALGGEASATVYWSPPTSSGTSAISSYTVTSSPGNITATVSGGARSATVSPLIDGTSYTFTVTASNASGAGPPSAASNAVTPGRGQYHPLSPGRILDTRSGLGAPQGPVGPGGELDVQITGHGGVPSTGVAAVVLNVTLTDTTAGSYLTVWPAGVPQPVASNLNWTAGKTVANLVEVAVGVGGKVSVFNAAGSTDVIFDVAGYVASATATPGPDGLYTPVVPNRVLDTRDGTGGLPLAPVGPGQIVKVRVAGTANIPSTGVAAVVLNVTATGPTAAGYLTVWPTGVTQPVASNLNFTAGQTVPNRVIVQVGSNGTPGWVSFYSAAGSVNVIADVGGWFTDSSNVAATGSMFLGVTPARILDTRDGTGGFSAPVGTRQTIAVTVAGQGGVPAMNASIAPTAVVLNVTVTDTTAPSYLTVWPDLATQPTASDLNWAAGLTVPNLVVVKVGSDGKINLYNAAGSTNVVIDVVGWYG